MKKTASTEADWEYTAWWPEDTWKYWLVSAWPLRLPLLLLSLLSFLSFNQLEAQQKAFPQPPPARDVTVAAIPGVIGGGAKWTLVWQGTENADGIVGTHEGGLLFAQQQINRISRLDKNGKFCVYLLNARGPFAVAIDPKGRVLAVERSCAVPGGKSDQCAEPPAISALTPVRKVLADSFEGKRFGFINDLVAGRKGGVYFTGGGAFQVSPSGQVNSIGENLRTNGIMLSPDEKTEDRFFIARDCHIG